MDEKSTIKDLERQASNTKLLMDRLNRAAYGMTFDELIRYMGRRDDDAERDHPPHQPASYGAAPALTKGPCP